MSFSDLIHLATLENQLLEAFPPSLFEKLDLPLSTHLKIYQGLPRYSEPHYPKHLFVKKEFSDLSTLKKRCIDKALLSTYSQSSPHWTHSIVIFTYVIPGGLGDYFMQQLLKKNLQKAFPSAHISTISLVHETTPLQDTQVSRDNHLIYFSSLETMTIPKKLLHLLRNVSLILQMPTFYPHWNLLIKQLESISSPLPFPKVETIGEYGFINSENFYPTTSTRCLGLHFLEYGLLLEDFSDAEPLSLQKLPLQPHARFYFAYLCTEYGHKLYLYSLLLYLAEDKENIDLCTPDIGLFLKAIENATSVFKKANIKEIEVYYKSNCSSLPIQETGKTLRIIHTGHLNHEEFKHYLKLSEEPVGIRGNSSLSEAISLNKTYFYDLLEHNLVLYYGLIAIARADTPDALKFLELYKEHPDPLEAAYACAALMKTTVALEELKLINETIKQRHLAKTHLENMVARAFKHYEKSFLEHQENLLVQSFLDNTLSFEELITQLRKGIFI